MSSSKMDAEGMPSLQEPTFGDPACEPALGGPVSAQSARSEPETAAAVQSDPPQSLALGVCSAFAYRTGASAPVVRAAVITMTAAGGLGVVVYVAGALVWRDRSGPVRQPQLSSDVGVVSLAVGFLWAMAPQWPGMRAEVIIPVLLVSVGIAMGWRTAPAEMNTSAEVDPLTGGSTISARARFSSIAGRIIGGLVMCIAGLALLFSQSADLATFRDTALALAVALTGVGLVIGPSVVSGLRSLTSERYERVRAEERARVASHLHDSVLQTLTLIQKRAKDPTDVAALALHQERSLRRWLYSGEMSYEAADPDAEGFSWREAFESMAGEIEQRYGTAVELVMVGPVGKVRGDRVVAVVAAAREALVNAAKFSGESRVSAYCELNETGLYVFVRDRGVGFDPESVAMDRRGIRDSIIGRMNSIGGSATVKASIDDGTEVGLSLPTRVLLEGEE